MSGYAYVAKTRDPIGLEERKYFLSPSLPVFEAEMRKTLLHGCYGLNVCAPPPIQYVHMLKP